MCGRTACSLSKDRLQKACVYKDDKSGKYKQPEWKETSSGLDYVPSLNIAPSEVTPVLINESHLQSDKENRIILPMVWGMIPPWHKGTYKSHGLTTNNCRLEGMLTSKLYKPQLAVGRRCVVVCEGFYEWQTTKCTGTTKQPYYIYAKQQEGVRVEEPDTWEAEWNETDGWQGPKLLHMAALFGSWTSPEGQDIYSYSVITMESNETLSWLHHRMPAILDSEENVSAWLDHKRTPLEEALKLLAPVETLGWHPVGKFVNNARSKVKECNKPVDPTKPKQTASSKLMEAWLIKKPKKDEGPEEKKRKTDP